MGQLFNCDFQDPHASQMFTCSCLNNNSKISNQPPIVKTYNNQTPIKCEPNQNDNQNNYDTNIDPPKENNEPSPEVVYPIACSVHESTPELPLKQPPLFTAKNSDVKDEDNNYNIIKSNFVNNS